MLLSVAGCGGAATEPPAEVGVPTTGVAAEPSAPSPAARPVVPAVLNFSARTLDGKSFDGASLAGRPAVLWFWAPWCPTCGGQAAGVASTAKRFSGKVSVVGVAGLDGEAAMKRFVENFRLQDVPHLSDEGGEVWRRFAVAEQSTFVLLDSSGAVAFKGSVDGDELAERVERLT
jgi:peroxiredoxin